MPRPRRADEDGGIYHALNEEIGRATIFIVMKITGRSRTS